MERLAHSDMADELAKLACSKRTWLGAFGSGRNKRPDYEIETRNRELAVLEQATADYRRAAERISA